jgi:hypothetical protein
MTQEIKAARECPEWCLDSGNIASLLRWLDENDELEDIGAAIDIVEKPWHWDKEYQAMRESQRIAEADAREEKRARR